MVGQCQVVEGGADRQMGQGGWVGPGCGARREHRWGEVARGRARHQGTLEPRSGAKGTLDRGDRAEAAKRTGNGIGGAGRGDDGGREGWDGDGGVGCGVLHPTTSHPQPLQSNHYSMLHNTTPDYPFPASPRYT